MLNPLILLAGPTRFELATSGVTGRRSSHTELRPRNPYFPLNSNLGGLVKNHKSDGTVKNSRCKARKSLGMRRTYQYAAVTKDEAQRRRWTFYEAVNLGGRNRA